MKKMTKNLLAIGLIIMMIIASSSIVMAQSINGYKIKNNKASSNDYSFGVSPQKNPVASDGEKTAVILNPFQWQRGDLPCSSVKDDLENGGYDVTYKVNDEVSITFLKYGLTADVVFVRGHGVYADLIKDDDNASDTVVLASGEEWTDETEKLYKDDIKEKRIKRMWLDDDHKNETDYVSYTPSFINYYYKDSHFPENSLVFMATCESAADDSMANAFINKENGAGAGTYIGWKNSINNRTNTFFSLRTFKLLYRRGFTVEKTCNRINIILEILNFSYLWLQGEQTLRYYGSGTLKISNSIHNGKRMIA